MHYTEDLEIQTTVKTLVEKRDEDAQIILQIIELTKKLNHTSVLYKLSEKIRHPEHINDRCIEDIRKEVDRSYWRRVFDICQIEKFTTTGDKEKIEEKMEENPQLFSLNNVNAVVNGFVNSSDAVATTMVKKVFERIISCNFRRGNNHRNKLQHKNNAKIEKSFRASIFYIYHNELPSYVPSNSSNFDLIDDLERVCYLVDGKTQPDRQKCIRSLTDEALRIKKTEVEGPYFNLTIFKNGNVKVVFLEDRIVNLLNSWGSDGTKIAS